MIAGLAVTRTGVGRPAVVPGVTVILLRPRQRPLQLGLQDVEPVTEPAGQRFRQVAGQLAGGQDPL